MVAGAGVIAWDAGRAREIAARHASLEGATLPILHALQAAFGYVDAAAAPIVAAALNLSVAEVYGVIRFYHDFRSSPAQARVIHFCRAEACQAAGCEDVLAQACATRGLAADEEAPRRPLVRSVYCLGNCALAPSAMVEGEIVGRVTADDLVALIDGEDATHAQARAGERL